MFSIAAINDTDSSASWEPLAPTKEAQEFHVTQTYHEGLLKLQAKDYAKARELFETVLKDPLISSSQVYNNATDNHLLQLRFLTLKNLATVFLEQGSTHYESALRCYLQATEIDANDSVVWNQLGTLSCTMGLLSTSRWAFEQGLLCSPNNWNCMEKLLEVLIAIGDEVACLSVADLILRHWPSHSRALHVKNTIEDMEPAPFAPRGIDKLEPKHARLKFSEKRKAEDDEVDGDTMLKKHKQNIEVELAGATWTALAGAVLGIIRLISGEVSVPGFAQDSGNEMTEQAACKQADVLSGDTNTENGNLDTRIREKCGRLTNINIELCLPASSKILADTSDGKGHVVSPVSTITSPNCNGFRKTGILNEKEICAEKEQHQERRSTRLERLRSRKSGKEDMEFANTKDLEKLVFQFLDPFILSRSETKNSKYTGILDNACPEMPAYSSVQEYNDVVQFISETSQNLGACHIGHLFLERVAHGNIPFQENFDKFLQLEKLIRHWGQDRTPLCSLFLAELCYDQGQSFADESKRLELYTDASYHLCKVIELVALDSSNDLFRPWSQVNNSMNNMAMGGTDQTGSLLNQQTINSNTSLSDQAQDGSMLIVKDSLSQEFSDQDCISINDDIFWVRFFWLSGHLSISGCVEKALSELGICLSLLRNIKKMKETSGVLLPHCRFVRILTIDRVLREINLLKLEAFARETTNKMMEKKMYKDCIELLAPLLLSTKDVFLDEMVGAPKEIERLVNVELSALDVLLLACEKVEPMDIHVYLTSFRRKLIVLCIAAGMVGPNALEKCKFFLPNVASAFDLDHRDAISKQWIQMVAEEMKKISRGASQVKNALDQLGTYDGFKDLVCVIGEIQSLILNVMCGAVKLILSQKAPNSSASKQMDQMEIWCLIDAAIAFCKLQHLDPSVPVKTQVDLIVAVHDLLAEYGLCCAGRDSAGKEGSFLKLAIKHLLALSMKLKSLNGRLESEANQKDVSVSQPDHEKTVVTESRLSPVLEIPAKRNEEIAPLNSDASKGLSEEQILTSEEQFNLNLDSKNDKGAQSDTALKQSDVPADVEELEKVELGIDNALDQSFLCLYGLNINPDSYGEDDLAIHKNTSHGDYQTKEQCADVFQYILPYAKDLSRAGLVKLRRVLRAIRKHFPQPPDEIMAENAIEKFLDDPNLCEDTLAELPRSGISREPILNILFADGRGPESFKTSLTASTQPYNEVYGNLYYLMAQAEETSATDKYPGFVLKKEGEEFVQVNANLFKYDLLYNPLRFESWQKLANIYDEEVDLLLNDGSKHINIMDWRKNSSLTQRVECGRRRSRRCLLMSLALAKTLDQQSQIHELLALVYYDNIQNVVPLYDQRSILPTKDATWMKFCQNSMKHFERAFALKPDWIHAFYLGKLCEKKGFASERALSYYSKAASLNSSALDPAYRMHASRLKLLYTQGKEDINIIQVVAAYAFSQSAKEAVLNMFKWSSQDPLHSASHEKDACLSDDQKNEEKKIEPHLLDEAWHMLYDDCLSALEICVEGELKHFHKARYKLAQGLYKRGEGTDLERAKDELSFCFKSSRSAFTINMWEIDGTAKKGRRKNPGLGGNKRVLEVSLSESSRKFITCIRKYILLYLNLLEKTGDLCTLERAYIYLRTDKRFSLCLGDIVPIALGKYIQLLSSIIRNAESHGSSDKIISHEQMLDRMFTTLMDHVHLWSDISNMPEVNCPDLSESNLCGYIHQYIHLLESDTRSDTLEAVHEKIRKRFKNPKLCSVNSAKICKHASLAWFRSILMKLVSITPLPDSEHVSDQVNDPENELLYADLEPDELLSSSVEGAHSKGIDMNWYEALSKIKNIQIRQASEENIEAASALMRCSYNFYRESSCGALPSGITLYLASSSKVPEGGIHQIRDGNLGMSVLDLSIPRKLLLWSYTLVHGRYSNISAVVKFCEDNAKSRLRRGIATYSVGQPASVTTGYNHPGGGRERNDRDEYGDSEDNPSSTPPSSSHQEEPMHASTSLGAIEPGKHFDTGPQLQKCSSSKSIENVQEECKGKPAD
ncbi:calcineurin-binding protein 1 isoform X1 [Dioscorea cayenensis subsp. rotundata]|uniref:Calcineurin-binding protein 1 isoform X1 n=3 Tax=Dioscorea cayennensis subsp. rotundata TaxID=55577 RepID=A0AB40CJI8_DIOCR|nr:calcineurin-binding protein 1 isoform X1 [Dioscorea cayenensis subsp. rotundata]